jgi:hypothetical protein
MPECIFCEDGDLPADTEECPDCCRKPFSGMYFDKEQYARAKALEEAGNVIDAWELLHEEFRSHGDRDHFDDPMVDELETKLHELFLRHPSLAEKRLVVFEERMSMERFWGHFASERTLKEGMKSMISIEREDLAEELIYIHHGINAQGTYPRLEGPDENDIRSYMALVKNEMKEE